MCSGFDFSTVSSFFYTSDQQKLLEAAHVGIAGAGGLGSNIALMLVRAGFRRFTFVDFDTVSLSNLNRQAYLPRHLDKFKVDCLRELCLEINDNADIIAHSLKITNANVCSLFDECDAVVEAFDNAESKALLFTALLGSKKFLVGGSGIAGIGNTDAITVRSISRSSIIVGDETAAVSEILKPYQPRVMVAAAKMADAVLEYFIKKAT